MLLLVAFFLLFYLLAEFVFVLEAQISLACNALLELENKSTNKSKAKVWVAFHGFSGKGLLTISCLHGTH